MQLAKYAMATGIAAGLLTLAGCSSTTVKNFDQYRQVSLLEAEVMPTQRELAQEPPRVLTTIDLDGTVRELRRADALTSMQDKTESYVREAGAENVDRSLAEKLTEEISLAEFDGDKTYGGPEVADYVIVIKGTQSRFSKDFTDSYIAETKDGKRYKVPAKCDFSVDVRGTLKIHELPSLKQISTLELDGDYSSSRESRNSSCPMTESEREGLTRSAAVDAIRASNDEIRNAFTTKGFVLEMRKFEDKYLAQISLGSEKSIKQDQKINFLEKVSYTNRLTGKTSTEEKVIATGEVSNIIGRDYAWVVIDAEKARDLRVGMPAKPFFKTGFGARFAENLLEKSKLPF